MDIRDDRLLEEVSVYEDPLRVEQLAWRHSYEGGLRIRTDSYVGGDSVTGQRIGSWELTYDASGNPTGGTWDAGPDGVPDGSRQERWSKEAFGWTVSRTDTTVGSDGTGSREEYDEHRRLLWRAEDWGLDGETDVVEQYVYDGPRVRSSSRVGLGVIDSGCEIELDGVVVVRSECWDQLHDGHLVTEYRFGDDPERARAAESYRDFGGGETEPREFVRYNWNCEPAD